MSILNGKNLKTTALIDGDYMLYVSYHNKAGEDIKDFSQMKDNFESYLESILANSEANNYIGFLSGRNFRKEINPDYKSNRKGEKPLYFNELKDYVLTKFNLIEPLEADDCVNICKKKIEGSFIVSNDKDLLNLEGRHYNPQKQEWKETTKEEANKYFWTSMIAGDTADNIKGIPGKGIKYAENRFIKLGVIDYPYHVLVMSDYIEHFGEYKGIQEFYKNYMCLKILDDYEGFKIPEVRK